ncbi:hypothetical protein P5V15_002504 [Pogonomyrmex californicus]
MQNDRTLLSTGRETSFHDLSFIVARMDNFNENDLKKEWFALNSDFSITEKQDLLKLNFNNMWKEILQRQYLNNETKYPNLRSLLNSIRALPNSNAAPERIFFLLTDVKTKKRNRLSSTTVNVYCKCLCIKVSIKNKKRNMNALNMKLDKKHLSFMSTDKLCYFFGKAKKNFQLHAADDIADPSSSNM